MMCFPCLFPTGRYGEFHPREMKLTFCEYVKSRLLNKDSRFHKNLEFVFYYLWQKELRELSSGIYNVLKTTGKHGWIPQKTNGSQSFNYVSICSGTKNTGFLKKVT